MSYNDLIDLIARFVYIVSGVSILTLYSCLLFSTVNPK
jgi:hypothetical protein